MTRFASKDEAEEYLSPYLEDIAKVVRAGWQEWTDLPSDKAIDWARRTRASVVHDGATKMCRVLFGDRRHEGISVSEKKGFPTITFEDKFVLRFKKLNGRKLRTSGIDTAQRREFMWHRFQLPDMPNPTSLIAGYRLDGLEQEIAGIFITCPYGLRHNAWVLQIDDGIATTGTVRALTQPSGLFARVVVRSALVRDEPDSTTKEA